MNPLQRLAKITLTYLERTSLRGEEVATYVEVHNWLSALAESQPMPQEEPSDDPVQEDAA